MNPDSPKTPREEMERRITALLLGELSAEEAAAVRELISHDRELTALHDRLKQAIALVREAAISPDQPVSGQAAPLKMSEDRREKLLTHFKTVAPREFVPEKKRAKFTIVELAAAVVICGVLAAMLFPVMSGMRATRGMSSMLGSDSGTAKFAADAALERAKRELLQRMLSQSQSSSGGVYSANVVGYYTDLNAAKPPAQLPTAGVATEISPGADNSKGGPKNLGEEFRRSQGIGPATAIPAPASPASSPRTAIVLPNASEPAENKMPALAAAGSYDRYTFYRSVGMASEQDAEKNGKSLDLSFAAVPAPLASAAAKASGNTRAEGEKVRATENSLADEFGNGVQQNVASHGEHVAGGVAQDRGSFGSFGGRGGELARMTTNYVVTAETLSRSVGFEGRGETGENRRVRVEDLVGDPERVGLLERPDRPYTATNLFVPRYANIITPPGSGLDVNYLDKNRNAAVLSQQAANESEALSKGLFFQGGDGKGNGRVNKTVESSGAVAEARDSRSYENNFTYYLDLQRNPTGDSAPATGGRGGGGGGFGGRGEVAGVRYNFVTNSVALANNGFQNSGGLSDYQVHAGFDTASLGVSSGRLSITENAGPPLDANGNKVPVLGNIPVEGRLFQSAQSSPATISPGFSLLGPTELPKLNSDTLTTSSANTFVGGAVANNGTLALGENRENTTAGFNLNVAGIVEDQAVKVRDLAEQHSDHGNPQDALAALQKTFDIKPDSKKVAMDVGGESSHRLRSSIVLPAKTADVGRSTVELAMANPMTEPRLVPRTLHLPGGQSAAATPPPVQAGKPASEQEEELIPAGTFNFPSTDVKQTLEIYAELSGKTVLQPANLPNAQVMLKTQTALTKKEAIQALDGALALNGITMIPVGDKYVKAVPAAQANQMAAPTSEADLPVRKPSTNAPIPQPEIQTSENNFSTFSLNVSDVSFKLAAASLEKGQMPDPASIRSEEFINAFDYRDPEPAAGSPVAFTYERARYPFAHNRDLLRFSIKTAAAGRQAGRPLNIVLLLDNSGSMERADRVQIIREALRVLATQLQPQDKLSVITFARTARLFADGVSGDKADEIAEQVSGLTPEGGTNLEDAMNLAYQTAAKHYLANGINRVVLLTDGAANLGDVEPDSLKQKVEAQRKQGIALDCFGVGWEGFNDDLLEVLSRNGDGRYGFINSPEEAATDFVGQLAGALKVAASDVKVQVEFNPKRVTSYRQIGYAKHQLTKEQFRDNTVDAAEIAAQEAGNALYTVEVNPAGEGPLCTVRVRYKIPGTSDYREQAWDVPYTGNALSLEQASPAMRLAASATAFAEWLVASPFAGEVTSDRVLGVLSGVPEVYGADSRPKKLEWMIREAKSLEGK